MDGQIPYNGCILHAPDTRLLNVATRSQRDFGIIKSILRDGVLFQRRSVQTSEMTLRMRAPLLLCRVAMKFNLFFTSPSTRAVLYLGRVFSYH